MIILYYAVIYSLSLHADNSSAQVEKDYFEIDHQNIDLKGDNVTLAWRFNISNQTCNTVSITSTHLCETTTLQNNTADIEQRNITLTSSFRFSEDREPSVIDIAVQNELQNSCPGIRLKEPLRFDGKIYSNTQLLSRSCIYFVSCEFNALFQLIKLKLLKFRWKVVAAIVIVSTSAPVHLFLQSLIAQGTYFVLFILKKRTTVTMLAGALGSWKHLVPLFLVYARIQQTIYHLRCVLQKQVKC